MTEERVKKNDYEAKLSKATQLLEESENIKNKLEFELTHQRKLTEDKD